MSRFSKLYVEHKCPECKLKENFNIQFQYGELENHHYKLGSRVKWGENNKGKEDFQQVIVDGMGTCSLCKAVPGFILNITNNIISKVTLATSNSEAFEESGYTIL
ncbi:MAG: hypothetical protein COA79_21940 [Planctomycetota bacterium]|nr:MAG: hypothetical protein COA79_21940 [Planctomycetota bacterium]